MNNPLLKGALIVGLTVIIGLVILKSKPLSQADGVLAPDPPRQTPLANIKKLQRGQWTLVPLAQFEIQARVLSRQDYLFDETADISPMDIVVGWGPFSDNATLKTVKIEQDKRTYSITTTNEALSSDLIANHTANIHLISSGAEVDEILRKIMPGHLVEISGHLIEAQADGVKPWRSSLSRSDDGEGSCEILCVNELRILGRLVDGKHQVIGYAKLGTGNTLQQIINTEGNGSGLAGIISKPQEPSVALAEKPVEKPLPPRPTVIVEKTESGSRVLKLTQSGAQSMIENDDIEAFLSTASINGAGPKGAVINGQFCKVHRLIDGKTGLKLVTVENNTLTFEDSKGKQYFKTLAP